MSDERKEDFPIFLIRVGSYAEEFLRKNDFVIERNMVILVGDMDEVRVLNYPTGEVLDFIKLKVVE